VYEFYPFLDQGDHMACDNYSVIVVVGDVNHYGRVVSLRTCCFIKDVCMIQG